MPKLIKKFGLRIWNQATEAKKIPKSAAYVGRPSTFGNPWDITKKMDRAACIKRYKEYIKVNTAIAKEAKRHLKGKDLVCWCQPEQCHAEILMQIANEE